MIEGAVDLEGWARVFEPLVVRHDGDVLRADRVYLEPGGRAALVEVLVIEAGRKQPFYARIARHDRGSTTVRVDPLTHPERSPGVREIVADLVALGPEEAVPALIVTLKDKNESVRYSAAWALGLSTIWAFCKRFKSYTHFFANQISREILKISKAKVFKIVRSHYLQSSLTLKD